MTAPFPCDAVERKRLPEGPFHICLMISLLFAGINISTLRVVQLMPKLLTQGGFVSAENRPVFDWNSGRLHVGIRMLVTTVCLHLVQPRPLLGPISFLRALRTM
jgi:hypothetical protein